MKSSGGFDKKMAGAYADYLDRRAKGHIIAFAGFAFCGAQTFMLDFGPSGQPLKPTETKVVGGTVCQPSAGGVPAH